MFLVHEKEIHPGPAFGCENQKRKGKTKMKSKKAVRSALGMSVLSIALCAAMLIGTTFAWFTDTATTSVNKIQSGTLKVDIKNEKDESLNGKTMSFKNAKGETNILWEPGATFDLDSFKIVNEGNLALKYKVVINGIEGNSKLLEAIEFTVKKGAAEAVKLEGWSGVLLPSGATAETDTAEVGETALITISGHMKETAGNEYQNLSIDGLGLTVYATQYTYEYDSDGNDYDKDANGNPDHPDWDVSANVTKEVMAGSDTVLENADKTVSLVAPDGSTNAQKLTLNVQAVSSTAVPVAETQSAKTYEVTLLDENQTTVTANEGKEFTVSIAVGKNLKSVHLYHGTELVGSDYDVKTGVLTFQTTSFSPYTIVYDKVEARIADTYYATVAEAIEKVAENGVVALVNDATICETETLALKKSFVLDGNGYALYAEKQLQILAGDVEIQNVTFSSKRPLYVQNAKFTLGDKATIDSLVDGNAAIWFYGNATGEIYGKVIAPKAYGVCLHTDKVIGNVPNTVLLDGATIQAWGPALYVNGSCGGHKVTAMNSTFTNTAEQCVYVSGQLNQGQTVTMTNCTVEGPTAIEEKHSDMTITGCTLTATGDPTQYAQNNNGGTAIGYCFATTSNSQNGKIDPTSGSVTLSNVTYRPAVEGCEVFNSYADAAGNKGTEITGYDGIILYPGKLTPNG